jgi:ribosomal protein L11
MGQPHDAEPYLKRALAMQEGASGPDHPAVASIMSNYAAVLKRMNRKSEAKRMEERAKNIVEKNLHSGLTVDVRDLGVSSGR